MIYIQLLISEAIDSKYDDLLNRTLKSKGEVAYDHCGHGITYL